ncbi:MAG: hypothetical protein JWP52_2573, partial [Rhizobacter sp.]|nr:hypothetical protein [Rhizobacter sp.]
MTDVVFSNKGVLSKPTKASVILPQFVFPSFELTFSDKTVEEMLKKDSKDWARARTKMGEDTAKEYKEYKEAVEKGLVELDAMCKGKDKATCEKSVATFEAVLKRATESVDASIRKIPPQVWTDWTKTRDKYKKYQYKTVVSIGKSVLGVVTSAVSLAGAAGTYGATLPLSIIALTRSSIGLATDVKNAALEVEHVEKVIRADAKILEAAFKKGGKAALVAGSMGVKAVQAILNTDIGPSMKSLTSNVDLWGNKFAGLEVTVTRLAGSVTEFVDKGEDLTKFIKALPEGKERKKMEEKQAKLEKATAKLLTANDAMNVRMEKAQTKFKT